MADQQPEWEILHDSIRHWIDHDGAHVFEAASTLRRHGSLPHIYPHVRVHTNGAASAHGEITHNLHSWLTQRQLVSKLDLPGVFSQINAPCWNVYAAAWMLSGEADGLDEYGEFLIRESITKFSEDLNFESLGRLCESVKVARQFIGEVEETSRRMRESIAKAAKEARGLPSKDDVWRHFPHANTRKGFDKALITNGFGWLPRLSNISLELR